MTSDVQDDPDTCPVELNDLIDDESEADAPLLNDHRVDEHHTNDKKGSCRCIIAVLCCSIGWISFLIGFFVFTNIDLLLRINRDRHTVSPPINPLYEFGGHLWDKPCTTSSNSSLLVDDRCTCLSTTDLISRRSTCVVKPDVLLKEYFQPLVEYYPSQLTYRPQIDCDHGRYLMVEAVKTDGMGMTLGMYNSLLSFATYHHLQLIEVPWRSTHIEPYYQEEEARHLRRLKYGAFEWEVPRDDWPSCTFGSAIHQNQLILNDWAPSKGLEFRHFESARYNTSVLPYLRDHLNDGLTVRFVVWNGYDGCVHPTSLIHAVRHAVDPNRIFQRVPFFDDYLDHPYIEAHVHLRRGDLGRWNAAINEWEGGHHKSRMITTATWQNFFSQVLAALPWHIVKRLRWTIYTEGNHTMSDPVLDTIRHGQLVSFNLTHQSDDAIMFTPPPVRYVSDDMDAFDSIYSFAQGDILFPSPSEFGYASCILNPTALRIGVWYAKRWHGCLNVLQIHRTTSAYPSQWQNVEWVPESVLTVANKIVIRNSTELMVRIQEQIERVDKRRNDGLYPHDQQKPDFIGPHREHLLEQLERDVELGFVNREDERYTNLIKYANSYDDGQIYDKSYFQLW